MKMQPNLREYQQDYIVEARKAFADGYNSPCLVAPCGAGKSMIAGAMAKLTAMNNNYTLFIVHRKELCDQIEETFKLWEVPKQLYKIAMVQTVNRRLETERRPDLIITDEGHHGLASTYQKVYNYYSDVPRISITATPIRLSGKGLGDVNDKLIEIVSAKWLIDNKFLAPYKYYAPTLIDTSALKTSSTKEYTKQSVDDEIIKKAIYGDVITHYKSLANGEQGIVYCHSIESSETTKQEFLNNEITAEHIDAKTPKKERDLIINQFKDGKIKILCNVELIGEGFDVPDCSVVIMMRPTKSLSLYIQQSMRGMRYRPNKLSKIIDHVGNVHVHGFPDDDREWSLKGLANQTSEFKDDGTLKVKQCISCFAAFENTGSRVCPYCGFETELEIKELERIKEIELKELKRIEKEKMQAIVLDYREPEDCKTVEELYELAKNKGYKPGWAYMQAKRLGML